MREHGGDIRFIYLGAQTWAMKESSFKVFLLRIYAIDTFQHVSQG